MNLIARYTRWLHTRWPAGHVEKLPRAQEDGSTNVPGLYVVGDLRGVPLLKFSAHTGASAVRAIALDPRFRAERERRSDDGVLDLVIAGGGVAGMSAALEARKQGLAFRIFEASEAFSTIVNFPRAKPIFTYPKEMKPASELVISAEVKEPLVDELRAQTIARGVAPEIARVERVRRTGGILEVVVQDGEIVQARRVIVALGRSGGFRKLGVPGENLEKVTNRLHDPKDFAGQRALVVGGGDSAIETAIALTLGGADVTLSYRKSELARPKPENVEMLRRLEGDPQAEDVSIEEPSSERVSTSVGPFMPAAGPRGKVRTLLASQVVEIRAKEARVRLADGRVESIPNDAVFAMIGRDAPLDFFRRSGVAIAGEWTAASKLGLALFLAFCVFMYHWKAGGKLTSWFQERGLFPFMFGTTSDPASIAGTLAISLGTPGFWYSLVYCLCILVFGIRRMRSKPTPYIRRQTWTLIAIQLVPLFLLPYVLLPWAGHNGAFEAGIGRTLGDQLFPTTEWDPQGREYWRAFGFVLAWPLFLWNVFTERPMALWLGIGVLQTFVLIPLAIRRWGKGVYCGWICSCGALAETLGDDQRTKMPHGPRWNRLNMTGQVVLALALVLLGLRVWTWIRPGDVAALALLKGALEGKALSGATLSFPLSFVNYKWIVDLFLAGILGVGLYFHFSGRVWCRFACPLAALMHVYARFSSFAIVSEKKKCISCNVCTSVCHQGIDVMNFANKGVPMQDPQCVRCSACVQSCPTGVLQFGRVGTGGHVRALDRVPASPVRMREGA